MSTAESRLEPFPLVLRAAEEKTLFIQTLGEARTIRLQGQVLGQISDPTTRSPHIESLSSEGAWLRLTDWVGRLEFEIEDGNGIRIREVIVYPAKLSSDPLNAFELLAKMADDLPVFGRQLGFPQQLIQDASQSAQSQQRLPAEYLLGIGRQTWRLWQRARRLPRGGLAHELRTTDSGQLPGQVDWSGTFELWGAGQFPKHAFRTPLPLPPPAATGAIRKLWNSLLEAVERLPDRSERQQLKTLFSAGLRHLPEGDAQVQYPRDPIVREVKRLQQQLNESLLRSVGSPTGIVRMAELYEVWTLLSLVRALGAQEGEFETDRDGFYIGRFKGEGLEIVVNPKLSFTGVGGTSHYLRPDLLAVFSDGRALVGDVKYRPIPHLLADTKRQIDDQLLRYMGLTGSRMGLVLWPAPADEPYREAHLIEGRSRLARVRVHPSDSITQLKDSLHQLDILGGH